MIYDRLLVALMSVAGASDATSTDAHIARTILCEADSLAGAGIRELARRCHVGTASISRFCRSAGFADYADLQARLAHSAPHLARVEGDDVDVRKGQISARITGAVELALASVDQDALARLVADIRTFESVSLFGLLKGQAAATDLQVDLLAQGKWTQTQMVYAEQLRSIADATSKDLFVIFSCTGTYFEGSRLQDAMARLARPKIWLVFGGTRRPEDFVSDALTFAASPDPLAHPFQLEAIAALIAQEHAHACGHGPKSPGLP